MRVMLDTNILISIIFFPSEVTRDFARRVGFGNRIVLCDYVVEELRIVVERKFPSRKKLLEHSFSVIRKFRITASLKTFNPQELIYQ